MFKEDNSGYILFPHPNNKIVVGRDTGKTLVYIVAFEPKKIDNDLSNVTIEVDGIFVSDDVVNRPDYNTDVSIDTLVDNQINNNNYDEIYFPDEDTNSLNLRSIKLISSICVGWDNKTYEFSNKSKYWNASFNDLTNEGKRLYYSMKKLHNNKEIRILTFNTI